MRDYTSAAGTLFIIFVVSFLSVSGCENNKRKPLGEPFRNPPIISSVGGVIDEEFDVLFSQNEVNGKEFMSPTYNGL